jgi:DNA-binding response OmpR family regulator
MMTSHPRLLQAVLKRMNFQVELAEDARWAEKLRHDPSYDLILLDLMMPRVNGYEFIEEVSLHTRTSGRISLSSRPQEAASTDPTNSICNPSLPFDLENSST